MRLTIFQLAALATAFLTLAHYGRARQLPRTLSGLRLRAVVCSAAFLSLACSGFGQGLPGPTEPLNQSTALQLLHSDQTSERNRAVKWLADQRQEIIAEAMKTLAGPYSDDAKMAAATTLGQYRASEAVDLLVANVEMERRIPHSGPVHMSELYASEQEIRSRGFPFTVALERIGEPAIPALIGKIKTADDFETEETYMTVCWRIDGPEMTQFRLQKEMEAEHDTNAKDRLLLALQMVEDAQIGKVSKYRLPPATGRTNLYGPIESTCALALTKIRSELAGLTGRFPVLNGVASAQITDHGFSPTFVLDLAYLKNSHVPPATNATTSGIPQPRQQFEIESRVLDPGGVDLEVVIQDARAKFPDAGVPTFLWLAETNGFTRGGYMVSYHLRLKEPNPDLEKAVKAVMDKQTGILKTNLLNLSGAGPAP